MKRKINYIIYTVFVLLIANNLINLFVGNKLSHTDFFESHNHHNYFDNIDNGKTHGGIGGGSGRSGGNSNGSREGILRIKGDNKYRIQLMNKYKNDIFEMLDKEHVIFNSKPGGEDLTVDHEFDFKYNKLGLYGIVKVRSFVDDGKIVFTYFVYEHQLND